MAEGQKLAVYENLLAIALEREKALEREFAMTVIKFHPSSNYSIPSDYSVI